jgi:cell division protein FtsW
LGASLAAGIVCWIAFEALVNIAVMVGAMPFAGNALPFISYGGSNLVMTLVSVGVLLSIARSTEAEPMVRRNRFVGAIHEVARREAKENAAFDLSRRDGRRRVSRPSRK